MFSLFYFAKLYEVYYITMLIFDKIYETTENQLNISKNGIITIHRGDTFTFPLYINIGNGVDPKEYTLRKYSEEDKDALYFALLEPNQPWEKALVRKMFTADDVDPFYAAPLLHFNVEDTEFLVPGNYYYEIKLRRSPSGTIDGFEHVDTVVKRTKFVILE